MVCQCRLALDGREVIALARGSLPYHDRHHDDRRDDRHDDRY